MTTVHLRTVDPAMVGHMRKRLVEQGGGPQILFGISYNTWCKVRAGAPIRQSVAERLERRLATLPHAHAGPAQAESTGVGRTS